MSSGCLYNDSSGIWFRRACHEIKKVLVYLPVKISKFSKALTEYTEHNFYPNQFVCRILEGNTSPNIKRLCSSASEKWPEMFTVNLKSPASWQKLVWRLRGRSRYRHYFSTKHWHGGLPSLSQTAVRDKPRSIVQLVLVLYLLADFFAKQNPV